MKQRIRLTESDLHRIVKESLKKTLLKEAYKDTLNATNNFDPLIIRRARRDMKSKGKRGDYGLYVTNPKGNDELFKNVKDLEKCINSIHSNPIIQNLWDNKRISPKIVHDIWVGLYGISNYLCNTNSDVLTAIANDFNGEYRTYSPYFIDDEGNVTNKDSNNKTFVGKNISKYPPRHTGFAYNPFSRKFEKMNLMQAKKLASKVIDSFDVDKRGYIEHHGYDINVNDAKTDPIGFLNFFSEKYEEPEDWYERAEHGDFDND